MQVFCFAQNTCVKMFGDDTMFDVPTAVVEIDSNIFSVLIEQDIEPNQQDLFLFQFKADGTELSHKQFGGKAKEFNSHMVQMSDSTLAILSSSYSNSAVVDSFEIYVEEDTFIQHIYFPKLYFVQLDKANQIVHEKYFGNDTSDYRALDLLALPQKECLLLTSAHIKDLLCVMRLNSNADTLWSFTIDMGDADSWNYGDVMMSEDGMSFFISAQVKKTGEQSYRPLIYCVDINGMLKWKWENNDVNLNTLYNKEGDLYFNGQEYIYLGNTTFSFSDGGNVQTESAFPSSLYQAKYTSSVFMNDKYYALKDGFTFQVYDTQFNLEKYNHFFLQNYAFDFIKSIRTKDLGYAIIVKSYMPDVMGNSMQSVFIKTDKNLQVDGYNTSKEIKSTQKFQLYFSNGKLFCKSNEKLEQEYNLQLFSLEGKILWEQKMSQNSTEMTSILHQASAVYIVRITSSDNAFCEGYKIMAAQ